VVRPDQPPSNFGEERSTLNAARWRQEKEKAADKKAAKEDVRPPVNPDSMLD